MKGEYYDVLVQWVVVFGGAGSECMWVGEGLWRIKG
jgi:hypothetical protein